MCDLFRQEKIVTQYYRYSPPLKQERQPESCYRSQLYNYHLLFVSYKHTLAPNTLFSSKINPSVSNTTFPVGQSVWITKLKRKTRWDTFWGYFWCMCVVCCPTGYVCIGQKSLKWYSSTLFSVLERLSFWFGSLAKTVSQSNVAGGEGLGCSWPPPLSLGSIFW